MRKTPKSIKGRAAKRATRHVCLGCLLRKEEEDFESRADHVVGHHVTGIGTKELFAA